MMFSSTVDSPPACDSSEARLEVVFNASLSSTVVQEGGMRVSVTLPSNGTTIGSFVFNTGDVLTSLAACLSRSGCYGLELINFWRGYYQVIYDGSPITESVAFPYYVAAPQTADATTVDSDDGLTANGTSMMMTTMAEEGSTNDDSQQSFTPYESNLTFVEIKQGSACVPRCDPTTEALYEVQVYAGSYGDGSLSWRIQDDQGGDGHGAALMGCEDDPAGEEDEGSSSGRCGSSHGVRSNRACLPRRNASGCRRFVIGHPNLVPSEGSEAYDDDDQHDKTQNQQPANRWIGHYHPQFKVSVDGTVVAEGTSATFASVDVPIRGGDGGGTACSQCTADEALLEIFQYRTAPLQYTPRVYRDLHTEHIMSQSSNSSSGSDELLLYERRCVPASRCFGLTFEIGPSSSSASSLDALSDGVSTQVILGGVHYANTMVRDVPFRLILGERCARQQACSSSSGESLVRVDINTSGTVGNASQHVPGYYCAWSVFDENDPPKYRMPEDSTTYFSNGYPGGGRFRHYTCVPDQSSSLLSFGMLNSVPSSDVTWSLERNGARLDCREFHDDHTPPHKFLDDYILTPLDGSCQSSPVSPNHGSPSSSSSDAMSTSFVVGIAVGIVASMAFLAVAVMYSGGDDEEGQSRRRNARGGRGGAPWSSNRSTGTVCESDSVGSDDDEGDCGT